MGITGHVQKREDRGKIYVAINADGKQFRRALGTLSARSKPGFVTEREANAVIEAVINGRRPADDETGPCARVTRELLDAINTKPSQASFRQACDEFMRHKRDDLHRKGSTLGDYQNFIAADLIPWFGADTTVESITTAQINEFREHMVSAERGLSPATAKKVTGTLADIMKRAKRKGWIRVNPCEDAERVHLDPDKVDEFNVLSVEQVHAVARAANKFDPMLARGIELAAWTGLRKAELLDLRWKSVNFDARSLSVISGLVRGEQTAPKSKKRRMVPLSDQAIVALDALSKREHFTQPGDRVFPNATGGPLADTYFLDGFDRALRDAGLGHLRRDERGELLADAIIFHDLRHTFCSLLAAGGVNVVAIQTWAGHAQITTTMRYMHYAPQHRDADLLTAAFGHSQGIEQHATAATGVLTSN